jgi:hypothetical protein
MFLKWCGNFAFVTAAACAASFPTAPVARAQDASWGCQILLCAASENPSWHGVPYCVPPMQKLIAAMSLPGFSWPICKGGNAGKPGQERYEPCPTGWSATSGGSGSGNNSVAGRGDANICERHLGSCNSRATRDLLRQTPAGVETKRVYSGNGLGSCSIEQTQPRKLRDKPYYFDIPNSKGVKQRFWFDLNK